MSTTSKPKIFLADLTYVNKGKEWTIVPFPLNIAFIAAYTQKLFPDTFDIRLFKEPEKFLEAITNEKPDIVGFSNYIWNKNLALKFAKYLKELHNHYFLLLNPLQYQLWVFLKERLHPLTKEKLHKLLP